MRPTEVPPRVQRLAESVREWPHFEPPSVQWPMTVFDSGLAEDAELVRRWSAHVWEAWAFARDGIARLVAEELRP